MPPETTSNKQKIYELEVFVVPDTEGSYELMVRVKASPTWLELLSKEGGRAIASLVKKKLLPLVGKAFTEVHSKIPPKKRGKQ